MPKYQVEVTEVKEGSGCGWLIVILVILFFLLSSK